MNATEQYIKEIYSFWKHREALRVGCHPKEEILCLFLQHRLSKYENLKIQAHIVRCHMCVQALEVWVRMVDRKEYPCPINIMNDVKKIIRSQLRNGLLAIAAKRMAILSGRVRNEMKMQNFLLDLPSLNVYLSESAKVWRSLIMRARCGARRVRHVTPRLTA